MTNLKKNCTALMVLLSTAVSTSALAKNFPVRINEGFAGDNEFRSLQVQQRVPPFPVSRINDTASAVWFISGRPEASGAYRKVSISASFQWTETRFNRAGGHHAGICVLLTTGALQCSTPLVLDLNRDGFNLGEKGVGVDFDLRANGSGERFQWVSVNTDDAFLVRDLNGNGIIDDGSELFGEGTDLEATGEKADNGYSALDQYDRVEFGGNNDGKINKKDNVWGSLRLWVDKNADGYSDPDEIHELSEYKISKINSLPKFTKKNKRVDSAGNYIPYWSWVSTKETDGPRKLKMADIYFRVVD